MITSRRGSALDVLLIIILVFGFGIAFLVAHYATNKIYDGMLENAKVNESAQVVEVLQAGKATTSKLDLYVLSAFLGLLFALIITAWYISGNPVFMGLYVIVIIIAVILAMGLSNGWEDLSQRPVFAASLAALPITNHLLSYLPYYAAVIGMLGIIVIYAKPTFSAGGDL